MKNIDIFDVNEQLYVGESSEEVINCEGSPCSFVYKAVQEKE